MLWGLGTENPNRGVGAGFSGWITVHLTQGTAPKP